jgi:hypothetical protein
MSSAAGTAVAAMPTMSPAIGRVAKSGVGASDLPTIPPARVTNGPADAANACAVPRMATLRQESVSAAIVTGPDRTLQPV